MRLLKGDCRDVMDELIQEGVKVDLVVTSPPYDDLRNYDNTLEWNFDVFKEVAEKLYKILDDGGVVVWVVNDKTHKGSETGTSFRQALYFKDIGFNLHDTMIWRKTNPFNFGSNNCYIQSFEFMFVFSKGKPKAINFIKDRENKTYEEGKTIRYQRRNQKTDEMYYGDYEVEMKKYGKRHNVWDMPSSLAYKGHTATFPEELARDHILSWSNEGDLVMDPFLGSGTTGAVAKLLNRRFIGIEKVESYFEIAKERIENIEINKKEVYCE
jgi:DNA modification methylase